MCVLLCFFFTGNQSERLEFGQYMIYNTACYPKLYSDMVIAAWCMNDLLNPPLQQVHLHKPLCGSILVEFCQSPSVFSSRDISVIASCDYHRRCPAAYLLYPAVAVHQARSSSHLSEQSDDSARKVAEQHTLQRDAQKNVSALFDARKGGVG